MILTNLLMFSELEGTSEDFQGQWFLDSRILQGFLVGGGSGAGRGLARLP